MLCTAPGSWQVDRHALDWKELRARDGLINSTACPRFITRNDRYSSPEAQRIGCCFKPAQQRLLTTRRYATCDNTTLGARDLLRALGPRRLALVGDSVTHQIWHALSVSLFESDEAVRITTRRRNEALQPRNFVADDVCSIKGSAAHGGSELNLSFTPVPACVNGTCRAACGERRPGGATAHHPGLLGLTRQGPGCAARPAARATEPRRAQQEATVRPLGPAKGLRGTRHPGRGMGVRCTLDGHESGRQWLLRSVCDHTCPEELYPDPNPDPNSNPD